VPISAELLALPLASAIDGRSVFLIDDETSAWARGLLDAAMRSPRAHVVVCTSREDIRGISGVGLPRLSPTSLAAAVRPRRAGADPRIRRAAERADGIPGRFTRLIYGDRVRKRAGAADAGLAQVAERALRFTACPMAILL
jgi:hypothetical protein